MLIVSFVILSAADTRHVTGPRHENCIVQVKR